MKFKLPYDLIILDLEANQNEPITGKCGTIIEIGAVRFLRDGGIHPDKFDILVNPHETLGSCEVKFQGTTTITELTGITQDMVDSAVDLDVAMVKFKEWMLYTGSKNVVLCGWGGDPKWLEDQCKEGNINYPFRSKAFDIKSMVVFISALMGRKFKTDSLGNMMKCFHLKFKGDKHRADWDAYNTALLLQETIKLYNKNADKILSGLKGLINIK